MHYATFAVIGRRLAAWVERRLPVLSAVGYTLSFVVLFGGVTLAAYSSGLADVVGMLCGPICLATAGFEVMTAAMWGGVAILFVRTAAATERWFVNTHLKTCSFTPGEVVNWAVVLYYIIGMALLLAIIGFGKKPNQAGFGLGTGWWWGGRFVLEFYWPKPASAADAVLDGRRP